MDTLSIITDSVLTYEQKVLALARQAENTLDVLNVSDEVKKMQELGVICDLFEGSAPYRPRYIMPDYSKFLQNGSEFLRLSAPKTIWEATNFLLILYKHVPSITSIPVYLGNLDTLLEPYVTDENEAKEAIRLFLMQIDRVLNDSFCHANIGPHKTKVGNIILELEKELQNTSPNLTLKYDENITPDDFAMTAIKTGLLTAKPSFANHGAYSLDFTEKYGISSCYNCLHVGGGAYTLSRLVLARLAKLASSPKDFLNRTLPDAVKHMGDFMDERIRFLVEESNFFNTSFLVKEGLINRSRFTGMFGVVGLAECVNTLLGATEQNERFGYSKDADELALQIVSVMKTELDKRHNPYCNETNGKFLLHAQVGIDTDLGISPGCRVPIGEEPPLLEHILQTSLFHPYFPSGIGDIFPFEETALKNPAQVLDIIKGAFRTGMRYLSIYLSTSDLIRITGYLVKRTDMERLDHGESVLHNAVVLGLGQVKHGKVLERKVRNE